MPSKSKKKTPSRSASADMSASPRTPSLMSTSDSRVCEEDFQSMLEDASRRYPSLIGRSAFVGEVTDVETESRGCKIWLSESSMLSYTLAPGSLVSVSLPPSVKRFSDGFPLNALSDGYVQQFGIESLDRIENEVGNYFALATVFPSCKVLKNGVRLSSSLSCTLGLPPSGRAVFVYTLQRQSLSAQANGDDKLHSKEVSHISVHACQELHLELVPFMRGSKISSDAFLKMNASPKTPQYQQRPGFLNNNMLASPSCKGSVSSLNLNSSYIETFDIKKVLEDGSARKLLQTCAVSWLNSRSLMRGNLVAVPMPSEHSIFIVIGANKLQAESINQDLTNQRIDTQVPESVDRESDAFTVNCETKVYLYTHLDPVPEPVRNGSLSEVQFDSVDVQATAEQRSLKLGGLFKEYVVLKDIIISSSVKNTLSSFGLRPIKGVLLHGPPGTGKTSLAKLCSHECGVNLFTVNGPEVVCQNYGESEQALQKVFDSASLAAPAVVFIDELDAIAPARKDGGEELSQRMVASLLNLMDGFSRTEGLLVIAATNRPDSIEPALRRPGRLDREIEIGVPSPVQRLEILHTLLSDMEHTLLDSQVEHLAMATHGFVGADLAALCNEAALVCLRHYSKFQKSYDVLHSTGKLENEGQFDSILQEADCSSNITESSRASLDSASSCITDLPNSSISSSLYLRGTSEVADNFQNGVSDSARCVFTSEAGYALQVAFDDFEKARMKVRPSAMREVILEVPKVKWEDVGGQREVKTQLMEAVEWPQKHQEAFKRIGTRPPTGILMFGPPGCSKTLMARAVASEAGLNFLAVKGPELFSKWVGESEKAVRSLFAKARANAPSIIFFDEIDGLAVIRGKESDGISVSDRVMSQLLVELDGLHERVNVTVIAATNRPDKIDPALLRPGRFDRLLYVGPPNQTDREEIFRIHLRKIPCSSCVKIRELACLTDGHTGADISLICREAAISAIEENLDASEITMEHLQMAIRHVQPSDVQSYKELSAKFQRLVLSNVETDESDYPQRTSRSTGFRFNMWIMLKSIPMFLYGFPSSLSQLKSASGR